MVFWAVLIGFSSIQNLRETTLECLLAIPISSASVISSYNLLGVTCQYKAEFRVERLPNTSNQKNVMITRSIRVFMIFSVLQTVFLEIFGFKMKNYNSKYCLWSMLEPQKMLLFRQPSRQQL